MLNVAVPAKAKFTVVEAVVGVLKFIVKVPLVVGSAAFVPAATETVGADAPLVYENEKSSKAYVPSLHVTSASRHLNQIVLFVAKFKELIVPEIAVLFAVALPSIAAAVVVAVCISTKFKELTAIHVPVDSDVASKLYSKITVSFIVFVEPVLHCSETPDKLNSVIVVAVLLVNDTPNAGIVVPDAKVPNALSVALVVPTL